MQTFAMLLCRPHRANGGHPGKLGGLPEAGVQAADPATGSGGKRLFPIIALAAESGIPSWVYGVESGSQGTLVETPRVRVSLY
jgi:hypothetical protein